jgi:hypothetical protein
MKLSKFRDIDIIKKILDKINIDKYIIGNKFDSSFGKLINKIGDGFASNVFELNDLFVIKILNHEIQKHILSEQSIHGIINKIILHCPHYVYCYKSNISPPYFVLEKYDNDLKQLLKKIVDGLTDITVEQLKNNKKILKSCIFQITLSMYYLNNVLNIVHNDIKVENFLYKKIKDEYIYYKINNLNYKIKTYGYFFALSDYGRSYKHEKKYIDIKNISQKENLKKLYKIHNAIIKPYILQFGKIKNIDDLQKFLCPKYLSIITFNKIVNSITKKDFVFELTVSIITKSNEFDFSSLVPPNVYLLYLYIRQKINDLIENYNTINFADYFKKYHSSDIDEDVDYYVINL